MPHIAVDRTAYERCQVIREVFDGPGDTIEVANLGQAETLVTLWNRLGDTEPAVRCRRSVRDDGIVYVLEPDVSPDRTDHHGRRTSASVLSSGTD
ncbi:MAG: hypothetical protein ABEJ58_03695 [Halodesulfurarchaeum sp.]